MQVDSLPTELSGKPMKSAPCPQRPLEKDMNFSILQPRNLGHRVSSLKYELFKFLEKNSKFIEKFFLEKNFSKLENFKNFGLLKFLENLTLLQVVSTAMLECSQ